MARRMPTWVVVVGLHQRLRLAGNDTLRWEIEERRISVEGEETAGGRRIEIVKCLRRSCGSREVRRKNG